MAETPIHPRDFFAGFRRVLEHLFDDGWLAGARASATRHPAARRWDLLRQLERSAGRFTGPWKASDFRETAQATLDCLSIATATKGNLQVFEPGSFANYGDELVQKRVRHVARSADQYPSLISELAFAAWFVHKKCDVRASEDIGVADFVVNGYADSPIIADCKHIVAGTKETRVGKVIQKANKQIKRLGVPGFGMAALDLSTWLPDEAVCVDAADPSVARLSELQPHQLLRAKAAAHRALALHNRRVNAAILTWNSYLLVGPREDGVWHFWMVRKSEIVRHKSPLYDVQIGECPGLELSLMFSINGTPPNS